MIIRLILLCLVGKVNLIDLTKSGDISYFSYAALSTKNGRYKQIREQIHPISENNVIF